MEKLLRYRGCLLGLVVGDALGATLEFSPPGSFKPITDMIGGGAFDLIPGQWTDDTSMALCLAESLIECQGFDSGDQMERYIRWFREGYMSSTGRCFGIGGTVHKALTKYEKTGDPFSGPIDPYSAGNGSLMRLAPVPMFYANNSIEAIEKSGESSKTTHGALTAIDACRYMGSLIVGALTDAKKSEILSDHYSPIPGYWKEHPLILEIDEIASGSFKHRMPPEIQGSGYVVKSLEAALWAFHKSQTFEEGCLLAVNLGDDADTTGAIFGQLAGAFYGENRIPASWITKLHGREMIQNMASKLIR